MPKLSTVKNNQQIPLAEPVAYRGCHCPMHTVLAQLRKMSGLSSLVVGMPECACYSRLVINEAFEDSQTKHYTYVLDSKEVIFGCGQGVLKAIQEMEQEGVQNLVVLKTCTPSLIGEDLSTLGEGVKLKVRELDVAHFKTNGYLSGYHMLSEALGSFIEGSPLEVKKPSVHLVGEAVGEEINLLESLLVQRGFQVLKTSTFKAFEDFQSLNDSKLSICLSYEWLGLFSNGGAVSRPFVNLFDCYDLQTLRERYSQIGHLLGIENLQALMEEGQMETVRRWGELETKARQRDSLPLYCGSQDVQPLAFTYAMKKLGFNIETLHVEHWDDLCNDWKPKVLALGVDPNLVYMSDQSKLGRRGDISDFISREQVLELQSYMGYERLGRLMTLILEHPELKGGLSWR